MFHFTHLHHEPPVYPEPGVYAMLSKGLDIRSASCIPVPRGTHILKIGRTTNYDLRRKTVCGRNDYNVVDAEPYFGICNWDCSKFLPAPEDQIVALEADVHAAFDDVRLSMDEADALHRHLHGTPYLKSTRPELFKLNTSDLRLRRIFPDGPHRSPRHGDRFYQRRDDGF